MNRHPIPWSALRPPKPRPADEFWAEFRQRIVGVPRDPPAAATALPAWTAAGAIAAAVLVLLGLWPNATRPAAAGLILESLDVPADHRGVLVLQDAAVPGVVVIIDGLQAADEQGEGGP